MGCLPTSQRRQEETANEVEEPLPKYVTADPDLGWRNTSEGMYPMIGFKLTFHNERSGLFIQELDLVSLALNIARRAADLADRYGVTDARDLQSHLNILDALKGGNDDMAVPVADIDKDMNRVMKQFGCPRFGWKLVSRLEETAPLIRDHPEVFLQAPAMEDRAALNELAAVPEILQMLTDQENRVCLQDVAEIGVNVAEQLSRLEKSEQATSKLPNDLFGWKILEDLHNVRHTPRGPRTTSCVPVATPEGEALMLIPEELIMNVASWVQATYLTAPVF